MVYGGTVLGLDGERHLVDGHWRLVAEVMAVLHSSWAYTILDNIYNISAVPATCPGHGQRVGQRGGRGVRRPAPRRVERVGVAGEAEGRVQPAPRVHHRRAEGQGAVVVGGQLHAGLGEVLLRNTDEPFNINTLHT